VATKLPLLLLLPLVHRDDSHHTTKDRWCQDVSHLSGSAGCWPTVAAAAAGPAAVVAGAV